MSRGHHGSSYRGLGAVTLCEFFSESADDEQAVVDRDAEADQGDHRLREDIELGELGDDVHDAQRARDGQTADEHRETGGDDTAEDEEQHHRDQRKRDDLGASDVVVHAAGHRSCDGLEAGQLESGALETVLTGIVDDALQERFDLLVVREYRGVVVARDADTDEGLLLVGGERP